MIWFNAGGGVDPNARKILEKYLTSPGSAKYLRSEVLADEGSWRFVHIVVDSQNQFGALLRGSYCIVYRREGEQIKWSNPDGVTECGDPPGAAEISSLKRLNQWPGDNR